MKGKQFYV